MHVECWWDGKVEGEEGMGEEEEETGGDDVFEDFVRAKRVSDTMLFRL